MYESAAAIGSCPGVAYRTVSEAMACRDVAALRGEGIMGCNDAAAISRDEWMTLTKHRGGRRRSNANARACVCVRKE